MWCNTLVHVLLLILVTGLLLKHSRVCSSVPIFLMSLFLKLGCYHTCLTSRYFTTPLCSSSRDPEPSVMFPVFHLFPFTLSLRTPHLMLVCDAPVIPLFHSHNQLRELSFKLIFPTKTIPAQSNYAQ